MNCEEVQPLHGPYLDSELDTKTTVEVQQHLLACADCARAFAADAKLDAQVMTALKHGRRSAALWGQIEEQVIHATQPAARANRPAPGSRPAVWWHELLWPSPRAWAGLAAVWLVMLALNLTIREPALTVELRRAAPSSPQMRQILKEQRQMLAELSGTAEPLGDKYPGSPASQPRSQRREQLLNT